MDRKKPSKILGAGGFGTVTDEGKYAKKHLKKRTHTIREVLMSKYLRDSDYIIDIEAYDLVNMTICTRKWDCSLRDCMTKYKLSEKTKMGILHDVLCGLCDVHRVGALHADVTLSNILIKTSNFRACLCDLGLSSIKNYSRVDGTAPGYKPKKVIPCHGHDMFGLAVCMACLFGDYKIYEQKSASELRKTIRASNISDKMKSILIRM